MKKRIVLSGNESQPAAGEPSEPGKHQRSIQRRSGLPRRFQPDRRHRGRNEKLDDAERRGGLRRSVTDRRRHRDRRFGLDPTLYDRLVDLNL
jgi:hypothetical protein